MKQYDLVADIVKEAYRKREDFVIQKLKDLGYEFKDRTELCDFAKERLSWVSNEHSHPNKQALVIDGKTHVATFNVIPEWNEETKSYEL